MTAAELTCLDAWQAPCEGPVEFREVPGREAFGLAPRAFPRCERHFELAVEKAEQTVQRYGGDVPPPDFDPTYAGERWDED